MKRILTVLVVAAVGLVLAGPQMAGIKPAATQAKNQETKKESPAQEIPPEAAKRANPVKPTAESIAAGKGLFATQCTMCHGAEGNGKGDLAVELKLKPPDWTDPAAHKDRTDGALFYVLTKGHGAMPGQEDRLKDEQKWNLINFIRSLAKKEPAEKSKP